MAEISTTEQEERKAAMFAKLNARHKAEAQKKDARATTSGGDSQESIAGFLKSFEAAKKEVKDHLQSAVPANGTERNAIFEQITSTLANMQELHSRASHFLPAYENRQSQLALAELKSEVDRKKAELMPKKAFGFSRTAKPKTAGDEAKSAPAKPVAAASAAPAAAAVVVAVPEAKFQLRDRSNETIFIDEGQISASPSAAASTASASAADALFANLRDCTLCVCDWSKAVTFTRISNCRVFIGPVAGPVYIDEADKCVFVLASRQLRIHTATNCDFYLHVLSDPSIEFCKGLRFAPYVFDYPHLQKHMAAADLLLEPPASASASADAATTPAATTATATVALTQKRENKWSNVQDFNWHRQQHSENWCLLPESERLATTKRDDLRARVKA